MAKVLPFTGKTTVEMPPNKVLLAAVDADLSDVFVFGRDQDGEWYIACSHSKLDELFVNMARAQKIVLALIEEE